MSSSRSKAVVTGASRGIGKSVALALAKNGSDLFLVARNAGELATLGAEIREKFPQISASYHPMDVSSDTDVQKFAEDLASKNVTVDILVNNAGIILCVFFLGCPFIGICYA